MATKKIDPIILVAAAAALAGIYFLTKKNPVTITNTAALPPVLQSPATQLPINQIIQQVSTPATIAVPAPKTINPVAPTIDVLPVSSFGTDITQLI